MAASQWLNFRLQMISVIMITAVGFTAVFQHIYGTANASLVGLALRFQILNHLKKNIKPNLNLFLKLYIECYWSFKWPYHLIYRD